MFRKLTVTTVVTLTLLLCAGCGDYISSTARSSLASFLSSIFSNAVNTALTQ